MSQKFYVSGTTCHSCEVTIERAVRKLKGVKNAKVSHRKGSLSIYADRQVYVSEIQNLIKEHGYSAADKPFASAGQRKSWMHIGGVMVMILALYLALDKTGLLTFSPSTSEPAGLLAVLAIGLVASVSSCTAVVGGLVVAVSSQMAKQQEGLSKRLKMRPHIYFNLGRLVGFAIFGALIGLIGSAVTLSPMLNGFFVLIIAMFMILLGISLLELFPAHFLRTPKWLSHRIHNLAESKSPFAPALLGAATFFLPCGFTQSMQLYALSLQSPLQASLVMTVFALGTMPALFGVGSMASFSSGKTLKRFTKFAGAFVMVLGISNTANGATLMGFDPGSSLAKAEVSSGPVVVNGKQLIQMEVTSRLSYAPAVLSVQKGIPVEWQIYGADRMGCSSSLVSRGLGINTYLRPGMNTVRFTPTQAGRHTFSCSMGMVRGTMIVTES